jgi:predicted DNA-binding protein (MmcQ/YjbR family)
LTFDQFRDYCLSKKGATEETPFDADTLVFKVLSKIFAITNISTFDGVNLKVMPEVGAELKERYDWVIPAYHMNKRHWITVKTTGGVKDLLLKEWIDVSYWLVVGKLTKRDRLSLS